MSSNNNDNNCAICFEPLCSSISPIGVVNPCGHLFHKECYKQWENTNKQRQRNSTCQNRRNVQVKCPTCNTMSKGFIGMYLNLESLNVEHDSDSDSSIDEDENNGRNLENVGEASSRGDTATDNNVDVSNEEQENSGMANNGTGTGIRPGYVDQNSPDGRIIVVLDDSSDDDHPYNLNSIPEQQRHFANASASSAANMRNVSTTTAATSSSSNQTTSNARVGTNDAKVKKYKRKVKKYKKHNQSLKQKAQEFNDLKKKYTEKDVEFKALQKDMEELINVRYLDRSTIERLQDSMNEMEKNISEGEAKNQFMKSKMEKTLLTMKTMEKYYEEKLKQAERQNMAELDELLNNYEKSKKQRDNLMAECKNKDQKIVSLKQDRDRWMNFVARNDSNLRNQIDSMKRKDGMDSTSSSSRSVSICRRAKKRAIEETMEEFENKKIEEARVQKSKQRKEDHLKMMRKSSLQAKKMNAAVARKMHSSSRWDSPATETAQVTKKINEKQQREESKSINQRNHPQRSTFPQLSSSRRVMPSTYKQSNTSQKQMKRKAASTRNHDIRNMFKR